MIISIYAIPGKRFKEPLPDNFRKHSPDGMLLLIKSIVLNYYGLTAKEVFKKCQTHEVVICRQIMHYLARKYTTMSLKTVGREFPSHKQLDHTTIRHSCKTVMDLMDTDEHFRNQVMAIEQMMSLEPEERQLVKLYKTADRPMPQPPAVRPTPTPVIRMETQSEQEKITSKYL